VHDDDHPLARAYHRLLVWEIMKKPAIMRAADRALNPLIGKSIVVYAAKPGMSARAADEAHDTDEAPGAPAALERDEAHAAP
jgi:hypothetical protein